MHKRKTPCLGGGVVIGGSEWERGEGKMGNGKERGEASLSGQERQKRRETQGSGWVEKERQKDRHRQREREKDWKRAGPL